MDRINCEMYAGKNFVVGRYGGKEDKILHLIVQNVYLYLHKRSREYANANENIKIKRKK